MQWVVARHFGTPEDTVSLESDSSSAGVYVEGRHQEIIVWEDYAVSDGETDVLDRILTHRDWR